MFRARADDVAAMLLVPLRIIDHCFCFAKHRLPLLLLLVLALSWLIVLLLIDPLSYNVFQKFL